MNQKLIFIIALMLTSSLFAQDTKKFTIDFSGFIKNDIFVDTRTDNVSVRDDHFFLTPKDALLDAKENDIRENLSFNMLSIQTRLRAKISGPDAFGAKTSGFIEGE